MTGKIFVAGLFVRLPYDEARLDAWTPDDPGDVNVDLVIEIGAEGEEGTTLFYAGVATPDALKKAKPRPRTNYIVSTRALIVMARYDRAELEREIQDTVAWASSKGTRDDAFRYLTRYYGWEFEDPPEVEG